MFTSFGLGLDYVGCPNDYLQIHDGDSASSPLIGRYCDNILPNGGNITSAGNEVFLVFGSDEFDFGEAGFNLSWKAV